LESEFALNIVGKFLFYLQVLPEEISLLRMNFNEYPDDNETMYVSHLCLRSQIERNCSLKMVESFDIFTDFIKFMNQLCLVAASCSVEYESEGKILKLLD